MTTPTAFSAVLSERRRERGVEQDQRQADQQQRDRVAGAPDGAEARGGAGAARRRWRRAR